MSYFLGRTWIRWNRRRTWSKGMSERAILYVWSIETVTMQIYVMHKFMHYMYVIFMQAFDAQAGILIII